MEVVKWLVRREQACSDVDGGAFPLVGDRFGELFKRLLKAARCELCDVVLWQVDDNVVAEEVALGAICWLVWRGGCHVTCGCLG